MGDNSFTLTYRHLYVRSHHVSATKKTNFTYELSQSNQLKKQLKRNVLIRTVALKNWKILTKSPLMMESVFTEVTASTVVSLNIHNVLTKNSTAFIKPIFKSNCECLVLLSIRLF